MNSKYKNNESIEQTIEAVLVESPVSSPSYRVNEVIGQNKFDILESSRISLNRSSFASMNVTLKCDDNVSNQSVCINLQSLQSTRLDDSDFDEQRLRIESSNLANDETNKITTDYGGEHLNIAVVHLDGHKSSDYTLNESTIYTNEQPACEVESNEALTKTIATVQSKNVNCDEKTLNERFDADFSQFASLKKNRSVLSTTTLIPDPIESVQNCEVNTTSAHTEDKMHVVSNGNADNEDDEFGDFSSFSPPTIAGKNFAQLASFFNIIYFCSLCYYYYKQNERSMSFLKR